MLNLLFTGLNIILLILLMIVLVLAGVFIYKMIRKK